MRFNVLKNKELVLQVVAETLNGPPNTYIQMYRASRLRTINYIDEKQQSAIQHKGIHDKQKKFK